MSIASEERQAIKMAEEFLKSLLSDDGHKTKREKIPVWMKQWARFILRHYPGKTLVDLHWKKDEY